MDYTINGTIVELTMLKSLNQIAVGLQEGDGRGCNQRVYLTLNQQPNLRLGQEVTITVHIEDKP